MLSEGSVNNLRFIKTKLAIFQPLIAILASAILSFTAGQYLSYVTAAISGSGITTVVPLAIFTVSAIFALVLVTYLLKLSVSIGIGNKTETGFSKEVLNNEQQTKKMIKKSLFESGIIRAKFNKTIKKQDSVTQMEINSDIDSKDKPSTHTSTQPLLTHGKVFPQINTEKLPHSAGLPFSLTQSPSGFPSLKRANSPNMLEARVSSDVNQKNSKDILLEQIKNGVKLRHTKNTNMQQKESDIDQNQDMVLILNIALAQRRIAIKSSDSESEHSSSDNSSGWSTDEERQKKKRLTKYRDKFTSQILSSDNEKGNRTPESGYRSDDNNIKPELAPLLHFALKTNKPHVLPKPFNLQMRPKISPLKEKTSIGQVSSEVQDPSTLPFKERMSRFRNQK